MAIHVTEQLRTFLLSILLGLGAGVLYDLLRAVRLRHPRLTAPLDLLYCQAVGLAVFLFVLRQSDGQLRGFILLGGLGGSHGPCGRFGTSGWTGGWNCSNF